MTPDYASRADPNPAAIVSALSVSREDRIDIIAARPHDARSEQGGGVQ